MRKLILGLGWLAGLVLCAPAMAQDAWPSKPIHWIVPYAAGGPADAIARIVGESMSKRLGQPVIIENKAGAAANIGHTEAARAKPDGYTILYVVPSVVLNPALFKIAVDPIKQLDPVAQMTSQAYVLMARKDFVNTMPEIIAKAKTDGVTCANGGGLPYFGCEWLKSMTKANFINAPFKGNGPAMNAMLGGHVDIMIDLFNTALPHIESGGVVPVALTGPERGEPLPKLPVVAETLPGFTLVGWHGVMAPEGTPAPIVAKLNKVIHESMQDPAVRKYMADSSLTIAKGSAADFGKIIQEDLVKYANIIKDAGIEKR